MYGATFVISPQAQIVQPTSTDAVSLLCGPLQQWGWCQGSAFSLSLCVLLGHMIPQGGLSLYSFAPPPPHSVSQAHSPMFPNLLYSEGLGVLCTVEVCINGRGLMWMWVYILVYSKVMSSGAQIQSINSISGLWKEMGVHLMCFQNKAIFKAL